VKNSKEPREAEREEVKGEVTNGPGFHITKRFSGLCTLSEMGKPLGDVNRGLIRSCSCFRWIILCWVNAKQRDSF
jgi:hypothetical protein